MRVVNERPLPLRTVYWFVTGVLFSTALYIRLTIPQTPLIDPDLGGYLKPALLALTEGKFQHLEGRTFLYPGFIYLVLKTFSDFSAVTILQHLLGVAAGGFLLICWNRAGALVRTALISPLTYRALGLGVTSLFLLNTAAINFEHQIRPEAIIPFFAILNIFLNVEFIRQRYLLSNRQTAIRYAACNFFIGFLLYYLKAYFWLVTCLSTVPMWIILFDRNLNLRRKILWLGVTIICVATLLVIPEERFGRTDPVNQTFVPTTLFVIHAKIIRRQIERDIEREVRDPYSTEFLQKTLDLLDNEIRVSKKTEKYKSLGFDPDYLMYKDSFCKKFGTFFAAEDPPAEENRFYYYYFFRTWTHRPARMLAKIGSQLSIFYNGGDNRRSPYKAERRLSLSGYYQRNCKVLERAPYLAKMDYPPLKDLIEDSQELPDTKQKLFHPALIHWVKHLLAGTLPFTMILRGATILFVWWNPLRRKAYGLFLAATALMFCYSFGTNLGVAIMHSLEVERYVTNQLIYCVLPQCMTLYVVGEITYLLWKQRSHAGVQRPKASGLTAGFLL
jgi:hypothetical protein